MLHPSWLTGVAGRVADPEGDVAGVAGSAARGCVSSTTTTEGPQNFQTRILCFSYHNLELGHFHVTIWLREKMDPARNIVVREVNFCGTTGFHGSWAFEGQPGQPYHMLDLQFNCRWPSRQELLGAVLLRVSATEWV